MLLLKLVLLLTCELRLVTLRRHNPAGRAVLLLLRLKLQHRQVLDDLLVLLVGRRHRGGLLGRVIVRLDGRHIASDVLLRRINVC